MYRIDRADPNNIRLVAAADIPCTTEIIAEKPLAELDVGVTYDPTRFFNQHSPFNGLGALRRLHGSFTSRKRRALESLHSGDRGIATVFRMNCFAHELEVVGQMRCTLRVYNHISRANHSCRPNVYVHWNYINGKGTLRALETIPKNSEILIEYLNNPEQTFRTRVRRIADLRRNWGFDCDCPACQPQPVPRDPDDTDRTHAMITLREIHRDKPNPDLTQIDSARINTNIDRINNTYLPALSRLGIKDHKVVEAYSILERSHLALLHHAKRVGLQHCATCEATGSVRHHSRQCCCSITCEF